MDFPALLILATIVLIVIGPGQLLRILAILWRQTRTLLRRLITAAFNLRTRLR
jgi:hypothetical protein